MRGKNKPLTSLKDVIANLLSGDTLPYRPDDARIWKIWDEVVGEAISKNTQPLSIKNKLLRVRVTDSIWYQELQFLESQIREKLNLALGRDAVYRIEFSVGAKL